MTPALRLLPLALVASVAGAQSVPGAAAKLAAQNAVAATDVHTVAMTAPGASASTYATKPSSRGGVPASAASRVDAPADSVTPVPGGKNMMAFTREAFSYAGGGRRDPFSSLMQKGGDLRPVFNDLRLVTIVVDNTGRNSVAILRDLTTKEQYRVRVGQILGRMRVAQIQPRQVVFTIEEFGYSRQETLMYNDPTTTRAR